MLDVLIFWALVVPMRLVGHQQETWRWHAKKKHETRTRTVPGATAHAMPVLSAVFLENGDGVCRCRCVQSRQTRKTDSIMDNSFTLYPDFLLLALVGVYLAYSVAFLPYVGVFFSPPHVTVFFLFLFFFVRVSLLWWRQYTTNTLMLTRCLPTCCRRVRS